MRSMVCDLCGERIEGDYKEVFPATTELIPSEIFTGHSDVCMKCWKAFTKVKRIPIVNFPNSEV